MREVLLVIHFLGLAMGLGTSFANMFLGIAGSKMEATEARKFRLHTLALSKMGQIGLVLLVVSGIFLMTPYWSILPSSPLLIAKLALVVVLVSLVTVISLAGAKAKTGDADAQFKKIQPIGKMTLMVALLIVILAVAFFQ
ncbi:MAG: hypothetical protein L6Q97_13555 [Thermoanaerobaculia bacterium]|nr:hypothetical protein [Thermoanaerobaculia bacterium]